MNEDHDSPLASDRRIIDCIRREAAKTRRLITVGIVIVSLLLLAIAVPALGMPIGITLLLLAAAGLIGAVFGSVLGRSIASLRDRSAARFKR